MKTLQDIKDEVYQEKGYKNEEITGDEVDEIAERYAAECIKASFKKMAENITISRICDNCNKEFTLNTLTTTIQKCSNCGESNHVWVRIEGIEINSNIVLT